MLKGMSTETPSERSKQLQFCADIQVRCWETIVTLGMVKSLRLRP
jgi:hypothetical protein